MPQSTSGENIGQRVQSVLLARMAKLAGPNAELGIESWHTPVATIAQLPRLTYRDWGTGCIVKDSTRGGVSQAETVALRFMGETGPAVWVWRGAEWEFKGMVGEIPGLKYE